MNISCHFHSAIMNIILMSFSHWHYDFSCHFRTGTMDVSCHFHTDTVNMSFSY